MLGDILIQTFVSFVTLVTKNQIPNFNNNKNHNKEIWYLVLSHRLMQRKKHFSCHELLITCFYKIYSVDTGSNEVGGFRGYFAKLRRKMSPNNHLTVC